MKLAMQTFAALVALALLGATVEPALAQSGRCRELWVERNSIFKDRGYCFKTARAIRYFGNAGCSYDDEASVPLSSGQRARIAEIRRLERDFGCQ